MHAIKPITLASMMLLLLLALTNISSAATADNPSWTFQVQQTVKMKGMAPDKGTIDVSLDFDADTDDFTYTDADSDYITGQYDETDKGKITFYADAASLQQYVQSKVQQALDSYASCDCSIEAVEIVKEKGIATLKTNKKGTSLKLSLTVKATVTFNIDGQSEGYPVSIAIKGKDLDPQAQAPEGSDLADSQWIVQSNNKKFLQYLGGGKDQREWSLEFEEDSSFAMTDETTNITISGTYIDNNGKVTIDLDDDDLQDFLYDVVAEGLEESYITFSNLTIDLNDAKVTAKIKNDKITLSYNFTFYASALIETEEGEPIYEYATDARGYFKGKGTGTSNIVYAD